MPAQPVCPYCRAKLFPHEVTNDECASCHGRLSAAVEWVPPARDKDEPAPRASDDVPFLLPPELSLILTNRSPPEAFAAVRQGIALLRWGVALSLAFAALASLGQFAAAATPKGDGARLFLALGLFGDLFQVVSALAVLLGVCFCCALPKECKPARGVRYVIACLLAAVVSGLPLAAFLAMQVEGGGFQFQEWLPAICIAFLLFLIAAVAGTIYFFLLLADLARFFGDHNLARRLTTLCVLVLVAAAAGLLAGCLVFAVGSSRGAFSRQEFGVYAGAASLAGLMIDAALSAWFVVLLTRLHRLIPAPPNR